MISTIVLVLLWIVTGIYFISPVDLLIGPVDDLLFVVASAVFTYMTKSKRKDK